ncbi:MAG: haloacid dehalogenase type II [Rhodospirillaceae bacterium]|nr:haloacid dehalogenase type II [Rhodospirillaceae bacterium]
MTDFTAVKALAFDYFGTIADKTALAGEIDTHLPGQGQAFAKLWFAQTQRYCFQNGMMERHIPWSELTKAAFKFTAEELGLDINDATRDAWIEADTRLPTYAEADTALARLAARFDLYVLSMGSPWMIEQSQQNAGIDQHFKRVISAEPFKVYKPGKAAYELGVSEIGASANEVAFVSGNSFDVIGASNYGYPTIWIRRYGQALDDLGLEPDLVVGNLAEMAERLGA